METATVRAGPATGVLRARWRTCFRSPPASTVGRRAVMYKPDGAGSWADEVLHGGRRDRQRPLARPDRPGDRERRQGLDPRQHPTGVDLLRLCGAHGRRHRGADLPDQLARRVPVRARELGRQGRDRRGRRAARKGPRGSRPLPEARARRPDDGRGRRRDLGGRGRRARRRARRRRVGGAVELRDARRHLHLHLHVGHDRPAEGLRDLARQLPRRCSTWSSTSALSATTSSPTSTCRWPTPSHC